MDAPPLVLKLLNPAVSSIITTVATCPTNFDGASDLDDGASDDEIWDTF